MSNLKSYLWNNPTKTSVKTKFAHNTLHLLEWPDFGFVGCPADFIIMSAYLAKRPLTYRQLTSMVDCDKEVVNHFLYVCQLLKILQVTASEKQKAFGFELFSSGMGAKLRRFFGNNSLAKPA